MTVDGFTLWFTYDASGTPLAVTYDGTTFCYLTNLQGDVVAILNIHGTQIVGYTYDAWGNVTVTYNESLSALSHLLGDLNPLRYRGYVYDTETGLYYLQSRYYNPQWGRFISADNNFSNFNLFIYCGNNPGNGLDPNGEHWYCLWMDDLANWVKELAACVSNIVYGKAAYERSFYDSKGASELWGSRPFQDVKPSQEMQVFTEFVYNQDVVVDVSISVDTPINNTYVKIGTSKVLSPSKNINASYLHAGAGVSTPSLSPVSISFSVGRANNINAKEDYTKGSWSMGGYGFDYSRSKGNINAYSFTVSNTYGASLGYDYYWCIN